MKAGNEKTSLSQFCVLNLMQLELSAWLYYVIACMNDVYRFFVRLLLAFLHGESLSM